MSANIKYFSCSVKDGPDFFLIEINHLLPLGGISPTSAGWEQTAYMHTRVVLPPGARVYGSTPTNTLKSVSHTEGHTWSASGDIGFFGTTPTASFSGSMSCSNSTSVTYYDVEIKDYSTEDDFHLMYYVSGSQFSSTWQPNVFITIIVPDRNLIKDNEDLKLIYSNYYRVLNNNELETYAYRKFGSIHPLLHDPILSEEGKDFMNKIRADITDVQVDDFHMLYTYDKEFSLKWPPRPT